MALTIYGIAFMVVVVRTMIGFVIIHLLTRLYAPTTARLFGYNEKWTGQSRTDFFSYELTFLFIAPLVYGLYEFLIYQAIAKDHYSPLGIGLGSFSVFYFYLLALTFWDYDNKLERFRLKSNGHIILRALIYIILSALSSDILEGGRAGFYNQTGSIPSLFNSVFVPAAFAVLTIFFIRRNKRSVI